jgi:hypothetical protein
VCGKSASTVLWWDPVSNGWVYPITDCSRPLDFTVEDAKRRPDALILESGEANLPGPVEIDFDMNLPGNTVYACLGETALLALEERYESFTVGRDIDWLKVKEIYKMARKHGVALFRHSGSHGLGFRERNRSDSRIGPESSETEVGRS